MDNIAGKSLGEEERGRGVGVDIHSIGMYGLFLVLSHYIGIACSMSDSI